MALPRRAEQGVVRRPLVLSCRGEPDGGLEAAARLRRARPPGLREGTPLEEAGAAQRPLDGDDVESTSARPKRPAERHVDRPALLVGLELEALDHLRAVRLVGLGLAGRIVHAEVGIVRGWQIGVQRLHRQSSLALLERRGAPAVAAPAERPQGKDSPSEAKVKPTGRATRGPHARALTPGTAGRCPRRTVLALWELDRAGEGVAVVGLAALEASAEPATALLRRAVRPPLRIDLALRGLLDAVVADGGGRVERLVDVLLRDALEQAGLHGVRLPDPCVAVGLELGPYRRALRPGRALAHSIERAEQVLHVVPVFVSDDVGLGEGPAA